jgi:hypothetical protein
VGVCRTWGEDIDRGVLKGEGGFSIPELGEDSRCGNPEPQGEIVVWQPISGIMGSPQSI